MSDLSLVQLAALAALTFFTSMLSALLGLAGGAVLLSAMLLYMDPLQAVPLHAAVQLIANGSRTVVQREHVVWDLVWRYALPLLPFGALGLRVAYALPPRATSAAIGLFVLIATWRPSWLLFGRKPGPAGARGRFVALGAVIGFLNVIVGAVGMLLAPFFLPLGLSRQAVVGTQACMQVLGHLAKLALFTSAGFALAHYLPLLALLSPLVIGGTWVGSRLLDRVNERAFVVLYRSVLTLIALQLVREALGHGAG